MNCRIHITELYRAAPIVMPPVLLCWPKILAELPTVIPLHPVAVQQMAAEGQSDKMMPDTELHTKKRCGTEFLHVEKKPAPTDIH